MAKNPRVLIVDASADLRWTLAQTLRDMGLEVVEAADGVEAVELLAERPRFGLVITALVMPKMNGAELVRYVGDADLDCEVVVYSGDRGRLRDSLPAGTVVYDKCDGEGLMRHLRRVTHRAA